VAAATPLMRGAAVAGRGLGRHDARPPLTRREFAALGTFGFIMSGTQWSMFAHLSLFLTEERTFSLAAAGLGLALAQGLGAAARLLWGWLSDLPGRRLAILTALTATSVACLAALGGGVSGPTLWFVLAVAGIAIVGWNGAYYALIADRAGAAGLGRASANALVFIFAGSVVMPPLLGLIVDLSGSWVPFWAVTAALVACAGVVLRVGLR
jgi:MFS family permease